MTVAEESRRFWRSYQVADFGPELSAKDSLAQIEWRNSLYPGLLELMPVDHQGVVLDYGCGPGIDTIQFLLNGAKHVHAVDVSPRALDMLETRLAVHGVADRCTRSLLDDWALPTVDYVHCAGVLHHVPRPVVTLRMLRCLTEEMRVMVYDADSWFRRNCADEAEFRTRADSGAPIANAWTRDQVMAMADEAQLSCRYLGSYRHPSESEGPGLSACYEMTP